MKIRKRKRKKLLGSNANMRVHSAQKYQLTLNIFLSKSEQHLNKITNIQKLCRNSLRGNSLVIKHENIKKIKKASSGKSE